MLLAALARADAWLDSLLVIRAAGESPISLLDEPCQCLKPRLHEVARRALQLHLERHRPDARCNGSCMPKRWRLKPPEDPARAAVARRIHSLGTWVGQVTKHFTVAHPGCCRWCGGEEDTQAHLWWRCPRAEFRAARRAAFPDWRDGDEDQLPPLLRCAGVLPEPVVAQGSTFWGLPQRVARASLACQTDCGIGKLADWVASLLLTPGGRREATIANCPPAPARGRRHWA